MKIFEIPQKPLRFWFFWGVAGWFQIAAFFALWGNAANLSVFCFNHLLSVLALFLSVPNGEWGWLYGRRLWGRIAPTMVLFLPIWGWILVGLLYASRRFFKSEEADIDLLSDSESEVSLSRDLTATEFLETPFLSIDVRDRIDLTPLVDLLQSPDESLKRGAVEKLTMLGTPEAIETLLTYRRDESADLRFYVTSALTKLKKDFEESIEISRKEQREKPDEEMARLHLSNAYLRYARSGLLDEANRDKYADEARYHLKKIVEKSTGTLHDETLLTLMELEMSFEKWEDAGILMSQIHPTKLRYPEIFLKMKIKLFYQLKLYRQMFEVIKELKNNPVSDPSWNPVLNLWGAE